jgi:hypothetical protein
MYPKSTGFIGSGGNYAPSVGFTTDYYRFAFQFRVQHLLYGDKEGIQVNVHNSAGHLFTPGDKLFHSAFKDVSLQKDAMLTFQAFNPDISAEADYLPFVAAAGMLLFEADYIT